MNKLSMLVATGMFLGCIAAAQAEVNIDWSFVGDAGNTGTIAGVDYNYFIGTYEVTNTQYCEFLNAVAGTDTYGLYNESSVESGNYGGIERSGSPGSHTYSVIAGRGNWPVNWVSFYDGLRFVNWLNNGQPTGSQDNSTTEDGAYDISLGNSATRKPGAQVFIPTEAEWRKAAYYKGGGTDAGYWKYATQGDSLPMAGNPPGGSNSANWWAIDTVDPGYPPVYHPTDVGAYIQSVSAYGTFDQTGNVWEWTEAFFVPIYPDRRVHLGGGWNTPSVLLRDTFFGDPSWQGNYELGFRVVSIPEPVCGDANHPYPIGDLNYDCRVNWADFSIFASHWLEGGCTDPNWCQGADMSHNGQVNWIDFSIFAENWLACTAPACD